MVCIREKLVEFSKDYHMVLEGNSSNATKRINPSNVTNDKMFLKSTMISYMHRNRDTETNTYPIPQV